MNKLNWNYERYRTRNRLLKCLTFSIATTKRTAYIDEAIINYSIIEDKRPILTLLYYPELII